MLYFENDYSEGAHDKVLEALIKTNYEKLSGYGSDEYCEKAKEKIKKACGCENAEVYFLVGGTQTNQIIIDTTLKPYEGVVSAETGHVSVHEAGAIEYTGHKVLTVPQHNGKIDATELKDFLETFFDVAYANSGKLFSLLKCANSIDSVPPSTSSVQKLAASSFDK